MFFWSPKDYLEVDLRSLLARTGPHKKGGPWFFQVSSMDFGRPSLGDLISQNSPNPPPPLLLSSCPH